MPDLDAYLERIGLDGRPTVAEVHRAHALAIPFENLDPRRGIPVSLEPEDLQRKLVAQRRGGFCFEQNMLLADNLEALGYGVELLLARVRATGRAPVPGVRPRTHCALRVTDDDGMVWLGDVGYGLGTPLRPLPYGAGDEHEIDGWEFRIAGEGDDLVLQARTEAPWTDLYVFEPRTVPRVDLELSSWYASTHPRHPMVHGLLVATNRPDGGRVALSDFAGELALIEETPAARTVTPVAPADTGALLTEHFGLDAALLVRPSA